MEKKTGGQSEEQISPGIVLYIVSITRQGSIVGASRSLYREPTHKSQNS